jgi:hypothetical protein
MGPLRGSIALGVLVFAAGAAFTQQIPKSLQQTNSSTTNKSAIVVPAGTTVSLALTSPIMARTAKQGDSVYAQTTFPVAVNNRMAIPPGTYVQGQIDSIQRPAWLTAHAQFQFHFSKLVFADGYTVQIDPATATQSKENEARPADVIPAVAAVYVDVSSSNDVFLDTGSQFDMVLQLQLRLNASSIAADLPQAASSQLVHFQSASLCRPTAGTPGTSDTVIPGTPPTPGTPDTVIPGVNGAPDTVIPGIPPSPGTPDTVIPGTPGTPGTACPGPPVVANNPKVQSFKETFVLSGPAKISATLLPAGTYRVTWDGTAPSTQQVEIVLNGKTIASTRARVVLLNSRTPANRPSTKTNADGSVSLRSLRFAGQNFALYFDVTAS